MHKFACFFNPQLTYCSQMLPKASLLCDGTYRAAFVMRGGDGMEVIMTTETTKVKKMDDNGTVKGKEYGTRAHRELGDGGSVLKRV